MKDIVIKRQKIKKIETWRKKLGGVASGSEGGCELGQSKPYETSASIQWALALLV